MKAVITDPHGLTVDILQCSKDNLKQTYEFKVNLPEDARGIYTITLIDDFIE